jgi:hypothetical protein
VDPTTFDALRLGAALEATLADGPLVRALIGGARPSALRGPAATLPGRVFEAWLGDAAVRGATGVNTWEGVIYVDRERLDRMLTLLVATEAIAGGSGAAATAGRVADRLRQSAEQTAYRVERMQGALGAQPSRKRTKPGR